MLDILTGLFDMISGFLSNIDSFFTAILNWMQTLIELFIRAADVFRGVSAFFPVYLSLPLIFIFSLVLVLRIWSIVTSGG